MHSKFAILIDGGFIKKKLQQRHKHFPTVDDIDAEVVRIKSHPLLMGQTLLRVYFYDAPPAAGILVNPLDRSRVDLAGHPHYSQNVSLQQRLEVQPDFALREGETAVHGWSVGNKALRALTREPRALVAHDLVPNIEQKGVDLRIGLDIARLSLRGLVDVIVVVTCLSA